MKRSLASLVVLMCLSGSVFAQTGNTPDVDGTNDYVSPLVAYVAVSREDYVAVIDVVEHRLRATIPIETPWGVAATPDGRSVYVTGPKSGTVWVISTTTNRVEAGIPMSRGPSRIAITPDGQFAYVSHPSSHEISVIEICSNTVIGTIQVGQFPGALAVDPKGRYVYVAHSQSGNVSVIKISTQEVVEVIPVGEAPSSLAVDPNGELIYVSHLISTSISVIDTATNTVIAEWTNVTTRRFPDSTADWISISPDGRLVYLVDLNSGDLTVIDVAEGSVISTIGIGRGPRHVVLTPDGRFALVASYGGEPIHGSAPPDPGQVSIVETATHRVVRKIDVGLGAGVIAVVSLRTTSIEEAMVLHPLNCSLFQNHPNPFNMLTTVAYSLSQASDVILTIYTITGQKVEVLVDGHQQAGHHAVHFDGSDLATGVYLYRLEAGSFTETRRMLLLR